MNNLNIEYNIWNGDDDSIDWASYSIKPSN